jgi:hypothetical protein
VTPLISRGHGGWLVGLLGVPLLRPVREWAGSPPALLLPSVAVGKTFDEFAGSVLRAGPESATASRQTIYAAHRVAPHGGSGAYLSERAAPFSRRLYPTASSRRSTRELRSVRLWPDRRGGGRAAAVGVGARRGWRREAVGWRLRSRRAGLGCRRFLLVGLLRV